MNTSRSIRLMYVVFAFAVIAILATALVGSISNVKADGPITSKNEMRSAEPATDGSSFTAQTPNSASKNFEGGVVPSNPAGTTLSVAPGPASKNYAGDYQP